MPTYVLEFCATMEGIDRIELKEDNLFQLNISDGQGERKDGITLSINDVLEIEGSRGEANYVMKWPGGAQQAYIKIVEIPAKKGGKDFKSTYTADDSGKWVRFVAMEARGIDIDKWIVTDDFGKAFGATGTVFDEVDLSDADDGWCDYDEKADASVSINEVQTRITRL